MAALAAAMNLPITRAALVDDDLAIDWGSEPLLKHDSPSYKEGDVLVWILNIDGEVSDDVEMPGWNLHSKESHGDSTVFALSRSVRMGEPNNPVVNFGGKPYIKGVTSHLSTVAGAESGGIHITEMATLSRSKVLYS